ncbi:hypothetical protein [Umezawaea sp. Da 62-37]|nr:hypothetical protein [Umezawaea sp. Da 62-37]WNV82822.1 hypothetical protein RM788_32095 [Umezawaea sp. Da 62-37]
MSTYFVTGMTGPPRRRLLAPPGRERVFALVAPHVERRGQR